MGSKAKIQYVGHATALVTTEAGRRILIDPWLEGNPSCPKELLHPAPLDAICLTHGHSDHAGSALQLAKDTGAIVYGIYDLLLLLVQDGLDPSKIQPMNKGGCVALAADDKVRIHLTHALHSSSYQTADGTVHYAGEACGVVIELESGRAVYHTGDTALFSDMQLIAGQFKLDVALLPIGDRFTMGPRDAIRAAKLLNPRVVVPVHYGTFPLLSGSVDEFSTLAQNSKVECILLRPGAEYELPQ